MRYNFATVVVGLYAGRGYLVFCSIITIVSRKATFFIIKMNSLKLIFFSLQPYVLTVLGKGLVLGLVRAFEKTYAVKFKIIVFLIWGDNFIS